MKKYILPVTLAIAASVSVSAKTALDGKAQAYVDLYKQMQLNPTASLAVPPVMPFELNPKSRTAPSATVFVTLNDGVAASDIEAFGLVVRSQAGNMLIASGSLDDIIELGDSDLAKVISFTEKFDTKLKHARELINMDAIHNGEGNLPQAYNGEGVICGVFDLGVDPNHPNFNKADQSETRVQRLWYYGGYDGSSVEYNKDTVSKFTTDNTSESHGTHTAGCMTGAHNENSSSSNVYAVTDDGKSVTVYNRFKKLKNPYYGMAPGADVIIGAGSLYDANILAGVSKMVDYAKSVNKPLVVNLSLGSNRGAHDEYESFTSYIDNLGDDAIICVSAGNEGEENFTIVKDFTSSDKQIKTYVDMTGTATGVIDFYSKDSSSFTVTPFIYDYVTDKIIYEYDVTSSVVISTDNNNSYQHSSYFSTNFDSSYLNFVVDKHENTSKRYGVTVTYQLAYSQTNNRKTKVLGFMVKGSAGQRVYVTNDGGANFTTNGFDDCDVASAGFSINAMACGKKTITVGAFNSLNAIAYSAGGVGVIPGDDYDQGKISPFSSYGELYDGRRLPHVCAPGTCIVSSVSSYDSASTAANSTAYVKVGDKTYCWQAMDGTSMACPIVAGAIATWCQAYPQLTRQQAIDVINATAFKDGAVLTSGSDLQWGAGRFNALGGLQKILNIDGVKNISAESDDVIISTVGDCIFQAFVAGASQVNAQLYNMSGQLVANAKASGDKVDLDASNLAKGIYVIKVNNNHTQRLVLN